MTGRLGGGLLLATGHLLRALDRRAEEDEVLVGVHFPTTIGAVTRCLRKGQGEWRRTRRRRPSDRGFGGGNRRRVRFKKI